MKILPKLFEPFFQKNIFYKNFLPFFIYICNIREILTEEKCQDKNLF